MARRSLRPHLNQIRGWVRQGRTDAWIAHQLEATVQQIETFKKDNDLLPAEPDSGEAAGVDFDDEIDLRAEDDALVAAELEAAEARRAEEEAARLAEDEPPKPPAARRPARIPRTRTPSPPLAAAVAAAGADAPVRAMARSRARSTTVRRATGCGWTPRSPTIRSTPSTGPAIALSKSRSRKTRS